MEKGRAREAETTGNRSAKGSGGKSSGGSTRQRHQVQKQSLDR